METATTVGDFATNTFHRLSAAIALLEKVSGDSQVDSALFVLYDAFEDASNVTANLSASVEGMKVGKKSGGKS